MWKVEESLSIQVTTSQDKTCRCRTIVWRTSNEGCEYKREDVLEYIHMCRVVIEMPPNLKLNYKVGQNSQCVENLFKSMKLLMKLLTWSTEPCFRISCFLANTNFTASSNSISKYLCIFILIFNYCCLKKLFFLSEILYNGDNPSGFSTRLYQLTFEA